MWHLLLITQHWARKDTRKYQTSSARPKLIEMLWYQLSATYLVQLQNPQILQPVALLMFRVEAIPMFLLTVPIQICQVKLVICFMGRSSISTLNVYTNDIYPNNWTFDSVGKYISVNQFGLFSLLCLVYLKLARIVDVYLLPSHFYNMCTFMSVGHASMKKTSNIYISGSKLSIVYLDFHLNPYIFI